MSNGLAITTFLALMCVFVQLGEQSAKRGERFFVGLNFSAALCFLALAILQAVKSVGGAM